VNIAPRDNLGALGGAADRGYGREFLGLSSLAAARQASLTSNQARNHLMPSLTDSPSDAEADLRLPRLTAGALGSSGQGLRSSHHARLLMP
jgi:hypothetical protein